MRYFRIMFRQLWRWFKYYRKETYMTREELNRIRNDYE